MKSYFIEEKTVHGKAWTKVQRHLPPLDGSGNNEPSAGDKHLALVSLLQVNPACAAQSLVVPDLIHGQEYLFRIRAENRFGFGPYAETLEGAKARDPIRELRLGFLLCCFFSRINKCTQAAGVDTVSAVQCVVVCSSHCVEGLQLGPVLPSAVTMKLMQTSA